MALRYDDFDLLIEPAGDRFRARLNGPTGQATTEFTLPFSDVEVGNFLGRIGQVRRGMRRTEAPELHAAKEFGGKLFNAVFSGEFIAQLRGSVEHSLSHDRGLRIRLRLTDVPELADLPWEFLYDPSQNHFLTTSTETPLVRFLDLPQRTPPLRVNLPLRVLVVIAGPKNLKRLDAEGEWERLQDALGDLLRGGHIVLERLPCATLDALRLRARGAPFHIFHFIGHGGFDSVAEDGVLQFEDEKGMSYPVRGELLGMQLHDHRSLRLAVLNACEGARSSRLDPFSGVAQSLLQQRVPAVIAMQFEISDLAAKVFAREFYRAIAEGDPVDAAVCESRKALFNEEFGQEWATPVLYMRSPEGMLFDLQEASPASAATAASEVQHATDASERERQAREKAETRAPAVAAAAEKERQARLYEDHKRLQAELTAKQIRAAEQDVPASVPPAAIRRRSGLPLWQVLAIGIPLAATLLALSWHHLRPHSDDGQAAVPQAVASPAPAADSPAAEPKKLEAAAHKHSDNRAKPDSAASSSSQPATPARSENPSTTDKAPAPAPTAETKPVPPAAATPTRIFVNSMTQAQKLLYQVSPVYPPAALQKSITGKVDLQVIIGKDGTVQSVEATSGDPLLQQSAIEAVKQRRYSPTLMNNQPVEVETTMSVDYEQKTSDSASTAQTQNPTAPAKPPAACTLGKITLQDQGNTLIGSVPYTYTGNASLQTLAVRGVPLHSDKSTIVGGLRFAQSTLQTASGTASFSIESRPALGSTPAQQEQGEYIEVAVTTKSSGEIACAEIIPYHKKW